MNNVIPFQYESKEIRVVVDDQGNPWWVAKDICEVLGISDVSMAVKGLDEDEKLIQTLLVSGQKREIWTINESGLYTLILRSNKSQAKPFRRWTTHEVLPSVRKTGSYTMPEAQLLDLVPLNKQLKAACSMAKLVGYEGNQAILAANKAVKKVTGYDCLEVFDRQKLICEQQEIHLTASDLGKRLGGISGQQVNKLLETKGLITSYRDAKNKLHWKPTETGKEYTILKDTGKKHGDGTPVQQLMFLETALTILDGDKRTVN